VSSNFIVFRFKSLNRGRGRIIYVWWYKEVYAFWIIGIPNVAETDPGADGRETLALPPENEGERDVCRTGNIARNITGNIQGFEASP
jgi:hypothetical protein